MIHPESTEQGFEMPMVKKYLPMYQSPELIEELKRHDRIRLIREREAREREIASSPGSISTCSRMEAPRTNRSIEKDIFPYQETQAYKNVLREFQRRTSRQEAYKKSDTIPLMHLSKKADKSKQVELLYPPKSRRRSDAVKKFAKRMIAPFKPVPCEKHKQKAVPRSTFKKKGETCDECSFDPEIFIEISSVCDCSEKTEKSDGSTSADETTDNESPR
ncbi:uncharacterized protein LOC123988453 [Osmia bicornis bicornis]|uniref:uncharacterized protein LOC123988453 n=1 Tax=Osmia bicornis bicornis TaxID=1437191 RepID=UPI001EAF7D29|nr:uncharacterized protein LOC123988453 [Osmia bicornis bicornis]